MLMSNFMPSKLCMPVTTSRCSNNNGTGKGQSKDQLADHCDILHNCIHLVSLLFLKLPAVCVLEGSSVQQLDLQSTERCQSQLQQLFCEFISSVEFSPCTTEYI